MNTFYSQMSLSINYSSSTASFALSLRPHDCDRSSALIIPWYSVTPSHSNGSDGRLEPLHHATTSAPYPCQSANSTKCIKKHFTPAPGDLPPSSVLHGHCTHVVHRHTGRPNANTYKINLNSPFKVVNDYLVTAADLKHFIYYLKMP